MDKSSRHSKIIGNFGEHIIANWLSRSGLEVAIIDHTGIDIVAYNPKTEKRYGITVKSRARNKGKEKTNVTLFSKKNGDIQKIKNACEAFTCEPWIGIYVENDVEYNAGADLYLIDLKHYLKHYHINKRNITYSWQMTSKNIKKYASDNKIHHLRVIFDKSNWNL